MIQMKKRYDARAACFITALAVIAGVLLSACNQSPLNHQSLLRSTVYCVAIGGDDSAAGSVEAPWASFDRAMEELLPGDVLLIRGGRYSQRLIATVSGEAGRPIIFAAYPGEKPVIDGTDLSIPGNWGGLVEAKGRAYLTFHGISAINSPATAFFVMDGTGYRVESCHTRDSQSSGVQAWGNADLIIKGNLVENACLGGEGYQEHISVGITTDFEVSGNEISGGMMEGIDAKNGCQRGIIRDNYIHDLIRVGIYIDAWEIEESDIEVSGNVCSRCQVGITVSSENGGLCTGIRVSGNVLEDNDECGLWIGGGGVDKMEHPVKDVEAWGNVIRRTKSGDGVRVFMVSDGYVENVFLHDNLIYGNSRSGVMLADCRPVDPESGARDDEGSMAGVRIVNNTIVGNGWDGGWAAGGVSLFCAPATGIVVRNNIVSGNSLYGIGTESGYDEGTDRDILTIEYNLIDGYREAAGYHEVLGDFVTQADPGFMNGSLMDFRLAAGSAAIGAGTATGAAAEDFSGVSRPTSGPCAAGAYEYFAP